MAPLDIIQKAEIDRTNENLTINLIERKVNGHGTTPLTAAAAETQFERARRCADSLKEIHSRIAYQNPADLTTHETAYTDMIERLYDAMEKLREIQRAHASAASASSSSSSTARSPSSSATSIKLPDIGVPTFTGKYEDWTSFSDLFTATIDKKKGLSDAAKLQYLKAYVTGDASTVIKAFKIENQNYSKAWQALENRYNNQREIVHALVRRLLAQPSIKPDNAESLESLLNTSNECIQQLSALGRPTDTWDDILVVHLTDKLDSDAKMEWAKSLRSTTPPAYATFIDFVEERIRGLQARKSMTNKVNGTKPTHNQQHHRQARVFHGAPSSCGLCKGVHLLHQCGTFIDMDPHTRSATVRRLGHCVNCLRDHSLRDCSSKSVCRICHKRHHTLVHFPSSNPSNGTEHQPPPTAQQPPTAHANFSSSFASTQALLKTAIVNIADASGHLHPCRVLIDGCSEVSIIRSSLAKQISLPRLAIDVNIEGVGAAAAGNCRWLSSITLHSRLNDAFIQVEVLHMKRVTGYLPRSQLQPHRWAHIASLALADPDYDNPSEVDILLGVDVEASVLLNGIINGPPHSPSAHNSIFGWLLSGRIQVTKPAQVIRSYAACCDIQQLVERFWKIEELPSSQSMSPEENACETHFLNSIHRKQDGRYLVRLPFRLNADGTRIIDGIGETKYLAERRLLLLERRFLRNPQHHEAYKEFMDEYLRLGHMELAPIPSSSPRVYIPHHFVIKADSSTTKLRVVFDASMLSTNGISLNKSLLVRPTVQDDLFSLLVRFRLHPVAIKADIAKMYRQYEVHEDDRDCQCILWRNGPTEPIQEFRLKTVTYGTASAPYLATRCLKQLSIDEAAQYPQAAAALQRDFYVDDYLGGAQSTSEATDLVNELISLIKQGGMSIRKWCSNSPEVMSSIPENLRETGTSLSFDPDSSIKALGVTWQPSSDCFTFVTKANSTAVTKRNLLSEIAKTFDPLGWLSPVTITVKILFQNLWQQKIDWDDPIGEDCQLQWQQYQQQLLLLPKLQIPRCVARQQPSSYHLVGFSDASEKAFAAVVYLVCSDIDGSKRSNLLCSRTRVAPLKQTTIPRLELCAAELLSKLMESIINAINFNCAVSCYTDSMIVLRWLSSYSRRWKTYVAHRVANIQQVVPGDQWHHVQTHENPADLPSRGITTDSLIDSQLWWHGPSWLLSSHFPLSVGDLDEQAVLAEERSHPVLVHATSAEPPFLTSWISRFSSLNKLISFTSIYQHFIAFLKSKSLIEGSSLFSPRVRDHARLTLIRQLQQQEFPVEIKLLTEKQPVSRKSCLHSLNPFIDSFGVIRVGGRLMNAQVPEDKRHPIILPKGSHLNVLIIEDVHRRHHHGDISLTLAAVRETYWLISAKSQVKKVLRSCIRCRIIKGRTISQLMGQFPSSRVTPSRPFLNTAIDYAGPLMVKPKPGRGQRGEKCWFAIFVCLATKAIHLEAVTSLSTEAFFAALRRFSSRRGVPSTIYSDCGTNFKGAHHELQRWTNDNKEAINKHLTIDGITWIFSDPGSPHQNGLAEAGVKSVKYHLRRVMGDNLLTLEQFQTLLCNIEACLNSRPLIALSSEPTDFSTLTPGHFLIGSPLTAVPEPNLVDLKQNSLSYWQTVQQRTQHFWNRWSSEYLSTLQQRFKWTTRQRNLQIDDLVLLRDENLPPTRWKRGRVVSIQLGQDGLCRSATIRTVIDATSTPVKYSETQRTIHKICPLLTSNDINNSDI